MVLLMPWHGPSLQKFELKVRGFTLKIYIYEMIRRVKYNLFVSFAASEEGFSRI